MKRRRLNRIFLSASIPSASRDLEFYDSADVAAIRDSVRALATIVIPSAHLIWGGHPSITPLINWVLKRTQVGIKQHVTLYQSNFYRNTFPEDNFEFDNIKLIPKKGGEKTSQKLMRKIMIEENTFSAGIFIGGMEGVVDEFNLFKKAHPTALILPIASTGAAAKQIFDEMKPTPDLRLKNDYAYMSLFDDLLRDHLK